MPARMQVHMEPDHARRVGSRFGFSGSVLGLPLGADEVVTRREPPFGKSWETIGEPRLWVIGRYAMAFELEPQKRFCRLEVTIDSALRPAGLPRLIGRLFAPLYARLCTRRIVEDAKQHFAPRAPAVPVMRARAVE